MTQFRGASLLPLLLLCGLGVVMSADDFTKRGSLSTTKWSGRVTIKSNSSATPVPIDVLVTYPTSGAAAYPVLVMFNGFQASCLTKLEHGKPPGAWCDLTRLHAHVEPGWPQVLVSSALLTLQGA